MGSSNKKKSVKPYTKNGVYYAGDSGLSEADFRAQRAAGTLMNDKQHTKFDPSVGLRPTDALKYYEMTPKDTGQTLFNSATADILKPGQTANENTNPDLASLGSPNAYYNTGTTLGRGQTWQWTRNPELQNAAGQFNQMSGQLAKGPQNAFSQAQMNQLQTTGLEQLMRNRQQTLAGIAGANAGRGITGNSVGSMLNNTAQSETRGALAKAGLEAQIKGLELGNQQYGNMAGVMGTLGNVATQQDQRQFDTEKLDYTRREGNRAGLRSDMEAARDAYNNFLQQYAVQMTGYADKKGKKSKYKDDTEQLRNMQASLRDEYLRAQRSFQESAQ